MFGSRTSEDRTVGPDMALRLARLERYWREIRGAARVPARSDVDPMQIDELLPDCFIVERVAPSVLRLRVAGARLGEALGLDVRGMPLSALFLPEGRDALARHAAQVFDGPSIVEFDVESPGRLGRPALRGRILMLPLADGAGQVTRAMGALVWSGDASGGGRRFTVPDGPVRCDDPALASSTGGPPALVRGGLRLVVDNT